MKKCAICGIESDIWGSYCKTCHTELKKADEKAMKKKRYYISPEEAKEKAFVRSRTNRFFKRHHIIKDCKCQVCEKYKVEVHHIDYHDMLLVLFVCSKCHKAIHAGKIQKYTFIDTAKDNREVLNAVANKEL